MGTNIISIEALFTKILEINSPWKLCDIQLENKVVKIFIDFERGSKFDCPICGLSSKIHDTNYRLWRHLDIADYKLYLMIKIPRIKCSEHGVKTIKTIPWGRINTHFTHKFENLILHKAREMSVVAIAREIDEQDKTLWNIIKYHIGEMKKTQIELGDVQTLCVDETSSRKGHKYVTVFTNQKSGKVIFVTEGKDMTTFERFYNELKNRDISHKQIKNISMDMSPSFICGAETYFTEAEITYDKFHIKKLLNEAVNKVRIEESKETELLKKTKYLWLKSDSNLTEKQKVELNKLLEVANLRTADAYRMRLNFDEVWEIDKSKADDYLKEWCEQADALKLDPITSFVKTLKNHWSGVINIALTKISNGISEGINSIIQLVKSRARGFRNIENFIDMIYLLKAGFSY